MQANHPNTMVDINSAINTKQEPSQTVGPQRDVKALLEKILELQDLLLQAQEKNLLLSAQARELERVARDTEDLRTELSAQGLILADKARENKTLHQEFSRLTSLLDAKLQDIEELKTTASELQHQVKSKEQERDILSVMLNEMENAQKRTVAQLTEAQEIIKSLTSKDKGQTISGGWLNHFKGRSP